MKHPFWLVNSLLFLFLIIAAGFIFFSRQTVPLRVSFEPDAEIKPIKKDITKIDLSKIYTNDLFDTYQQALPVPTAPELVKPMPPPPVPKPVTMPIKQAPKFLEPLQINLRGIIVSSDDRLNIAIIEETREKRTKNYKTGDKIEDSQLIRILKNKIILVRSNGQQETLFVSHFDAEMDPILLSATNSWSLIIQKNADYGYLIDPDLFVERIHNLAQLIDMLNITTAYRQGKSIGCRIGKLQPNSLGQALGLMSGDIVETINSISVTETNNRFEAYKKIISLKLGDTVTLNVARKNEMITLTYTLEKLDKDVTKSSIPASQLFSTKSSQEIHDEKIKILEEKYKFAPTVDQLEKQDKQLMLQHNNTRIAQHRQDRGILMSNLQPER